MKFKMERDKKLFMLQNKTWMEVSLRQCFPTSHPEKFFSVSNKETQEVALIENLDVLESDDQKIIREYLEIKNFCYEVVGVYRVSEDFGVRNFEVKTKQGDRSFQVSLDDWPEEVKGGLLQVLDLYGEKYRFLQLEFGHEILRSYL